jgi:hypothetical protein
MHWAKPSRAAWYSTGNVLGSSFPFPLCKNVPSLSAINGGSSLNEGKTLKNHRETIETNYSGKIIKKRTEK